MFFEGDKESVEKAMRQHVPINEQKREPEPDLDKTLCWIYERVSYIRQPIGKAVVIEVINDEGYSRVHEFDEDSDSEVSNAQVFKNAITELMDKYPVE